MINHIIILLHLYGTIISTVAVDIGLVPRSCIRPYIICNNFAALQRDPCCLNTTGVTTIVDPGHLRSWSMRQIFRIEPRIDSHKGKFL